MSLHLETQQLLQLLGHRAYEAYSQSRPWTGLWPSLPGFAGTSGPGKSPKVTLAVFLGLRCENDDALVSSTSPLRQVLGDELAAFSIAWPLGLRNLLAMCEEVSLSIAWPLGLRNLLAINADSSFPCSLLLSIFPVRASAQAILELLITDPSMLTPANESPVTEPWAPSSLVSFCLGMSLCCCLPKLAVLG
jgi:hypothetical protein